MFKKILLLLFPQHCTFCNTKGKQVCESCFGKIIPEINESENIFSFYSYKDKMVDDLIWNLKYHHEHDVAEIFGTKISALIKEKTPLKLFQEIFSSDKIIFIPIPKNNFDPRLHNHAEIFAKSLAKNLSPKIQLVENLLKKNSQKKQAHTNTKEERMVNLHGAISLSFFTKEKLRVTLEDPETKIFIIDDVTTSGATINEVKKVLKENYKIKNQILAITIAH